MKEGSYNDALSNALALVNNADKSLSKDALNNARNIAWYKLGDKTNGAEYFRQILFAVFGSVPIGFVSCH